MAANETNRNLNYSSGSRVRQINGYNLTTNGELTTSLTISFSNTIRLNRITFKPTTSNVGDNFDLRIQSNELLDSVSLAIRPGSSGQNINLTTNIDLRRGWELLADRENQQLSLGTITNVTVINEATTPTISVTVQRDPNLSIPPIFQVTGLTDIRYSIPLMNNIFIVDDEKIVYEAHSYSFFSINNERDSPNILNASSINRIPSRQNYDSTDSYIMDESVQRDNSRHRGLELINLIERLGIILRLNRSKNESTNINNSALFRGRTRRRPRPSINNNSNNNSTQELNLSALSELINDLIIFYDLIHSDQDLVVTYNTDNTDNKSLVLYIDSTRITSLF